MKIRIESKHIRSNVFFALIGLLFFTASVMRLFANGANVADFGFILNNIKHLPDEPWSPLVGHFQPIAYIFFPLSLIPGQWLAILLLWIQCLFTTATGWILSRKFGIASAYVFFLNPFTWALIYFDFHYECIAALCISIFFYKIFSGKIYSSICYLLIFSCVKEIYIAFSAAILISLSFSKRFEIEERKVLLVSGAIFVVVFLLVVTLIIPEFISEETRSSIVNIYGPALSLDFSDLGSFALVKTLVIFLATSVLLRIKNIIVLLALLALLLPYLLSPNENHHLYTAHYWSVFIPIMIGLESSFSKRSSIISSINVQRYTLIGAIILYVSFSTGPLGRIALKPETLDYGLSSYISFSKNKQLSDWAVIQNIGNIAVQNNALFPALMNAEVILPFPNGIFTEWVSENGKRFAAEHIILDVSKQAFLTDISCSNIAGKCAAANDRLTELILQKKIQLVLSSENGLRVYKVNK